MKNLATMKCQISSYIGLYILCSTSVYASNINNTNTIDSINTIESQKYHNNIGLLALSNDSKESLITASNVDYIKEDEDITTTQNNKKCSSTNIDSNSKATANKTKPNTKSTILSNTNNMNKFRDRLNHFNCDLAYQFFADNLEESFGYWDTRTLFAQSFAPKCGIAFFNQHIYLGGYFIINMGERYPIPTDLNRGYGISLHYDISYKNFKGYFGIFSRGYYIGDYPLLYYRDDYKFFNPMANGMLLQYDNKQKNIKAEALIDWYGGNIQKRIDEFLVQGFLSQGFFNNILYYGMSALLYHTKNPEILNTDSTNQDVYLLDRYYYNLYIGSNIESIMPYMDKADIRLGLLGSLERKRRESSGEDPFSNTLGGFFDIYVQYKGFGIYNSLYIGDSHYKYFSEYAENIYNGLPFYQANVYDRLETYYQYSWRFVTIKFRLIFHFTNDFYKTSRGNFAHQQVLTIDVKL